MGLIRAAVQAALTLSAGLLSVQGQLLGLPSPIVCQYPPEWQSCHSPTSRDCWIRKPGRQSEGPSVTQFDILSDYEEMYPPGVTREYWLEVGANSKVAPDGQPKTDGQYFNGTYPGPLIEACWGDEIVVHVTNRGDSKNGTTVHWHGMRQLNTNEMDGVNGITQCPIAPGDTFTYKFRATQYGHTWYHSHYSMQYADGVVGPLVIHGPSSLDWDVDLGPVLLTDWIHDSAYNGFSTMEIPGKAFYVDSILVNGHGHFNCSPALSDNDCAGSYWETSFVPGKKHRMQLVNTGFNYPIIFSIDQHNLTVIANDLVAIEPFTVPSLTISPGQRYTIVVEAKQELDDDANYWIRTGTECGGWNAAVTDNRTAIIHYDGAVQKLPTVDHPMPFNATCLDVPARLLRPKVPWRVDEHPRSILNYTATKQTNASHSLGPPWYKHWTLGKQPMWLDFSKPTILDPDTSLRNVNYTATEENYGTGFIYLIIDANPLLPSNHPLHLHGSDFAVLAQETVPWDPATGPSLFKYDNPPRRDTVMLPHTGFVALAFRPSNPGAWLLHCHISSHASSGLAAQILIRHGVDAVDTGRGDLDGVRAGCRAWSESSLSKTVVQEDSGI
ncbi:multicopper like protein [Thermothielavioides terrestris NRRL 8126]|uniref:Multicopper like protein n=1 Tax=Thermothielavioides terrestris (strain ATCC 38088 / NRRL 8126) TaxID=578455 RepID=G2QX45_THETT|nr:multicopper like protein [Thermothielavioides terrestris NRRL 8126]AEO64812.1 multicopper like protein [Thermothielavioides terrestris NRRL 8126]